MTREIKYARTAFGDIAYTERGGGPPALFVHGVFLNGFLWRHVVGHVADLLRCFLIDLMSHGAPQVSTDQDLCFNAQAAALEAFLLGSASGQAASVASY